MRNKLLLVITVVCVLLCGCSANKETIEEQADVQVVQDVVGEWNGLAIYTNNELTPIDKGLISGTINDDNTFKFIVNGKTLSGVWAEIDSNELEEGEMAYNFVSNEGEQVAQGILSDKNTFIDPNSTFTLSMVFDGGNLWVQFEK